MSQSNHAIVRLLTVVLPLSVNQIIAWGTIYFSFSLFIEPIHRDLDWSHSAIAGGVSFALGVAAAAQLFIGRVIDRWGAHGVMCIGASLGAAAMIFLSVNASLVGFYIAWGALGLTIALCFFEPAFAVLLDELPAEFERAVSTLVLLSGLSSALFLPLAQWLIQRSGWRDALFVFGVFNLFSAALSFVLFHVRKRRPTNNADVAAVTIDWHRNAPARIASTEFMRLRFWCLAVAFALNTGAVTTLVIHLLGILSASGFTATSALVAIAMIGPTQILGRLVHTFLAGRSSFRSITFAAFVAFFVGLVCLQLSIPSGWLIWLAVVLMGMGSGMMTTMRGTIVALLFGRRDYARVSNIVAAPGSLARAIAPLAASLLVTTSLGYRGLGWIVCAIATLALASITYSLIAYQDE